MVTVLLLADSSNGSSHLSAIRHNVEGTLQRLITDGISVGLTTTDAVLAWTLLLCAMDVVVVRRYELLTLLLSVVRNALLALVALAEGVVWRR